ncbi:MAG: hypothetical protein Tsb0010_14900 [Parvularculaceae bacterium]
MHKIQLAAAAFSVLASTAAGAQEARDYDLAPFTEIDASIVTLEVTVGPAQSVSIVAERGDLDDLDVYVRNGELNIEPKRRINFGRNKRFTATITLPSLEGLDLSAGADAHVTGVDADEFMIDLSSGAQAEITGTCRELEVDISSGARIRARNFICAEAIADASSGATGDIHASEAVNADASSGGRLRVYGGPTRVRVDTSSGGDVDIRSDGAE